MCHHNSHQCNKDTLTAETLLYAASARFRESSLMDEYRQAQREKWEAQREVEEEGGLPEEVLPAEITSSDPSSDLVVPPVLQAENDDEEEEGEVDYQRIPPHALPQTPLAPCAPYHGLAVSGAMRDRIPKQFRRKLLEWLRRSRQAAQASDATPNDGGVLPDPMVAMTPATDHILSTFRSGIRSKRSNVDAYSLSILEGNSVVFGHQFDAIFEEDAIMQVAGHYSDRSTGQFEDDWIPELSSEQKQHFHSWKRPSDFMRSPKLFACHPPNPDLILQNMVGDCAFLASLIVAACYERRFPQHPLLTSLVFPQKYNPHGKYLIRLFFNGAWRKVEIDDRLPVDEHNNLLCGHSANPSELWVSLYEKAFLKVKNERGYAMDGSQSRLDLHCLTGDWLSMVQDTSDTSVINIDSIWGQLSNSFSKGECLITLAANEGQQGVHGRHAYAVMDVCPIVVEGIRLLLIKNPWGVRGRWEGKYSPNDPESWTEELREGLGYWPELAAMNDDGAFFMTIEDVCEVYDRISFTWDPHRKFPFHTPTFHAMWKLSEDPETEPWFANVNLSRNPQFKLTVRGVGVTWFALTRHGLMGDLSDESKNASMAALVYGGTEGKRVRHRQQYLNQPPVQFSRFPAVEEIPILPDGGEDSVYTIVVQQYDIPYQQDPFTISVHSWADVSIEPLPLPPLPQKMITGEWKEETAAGNMNGENWASFARNPMFTLLVLQECSPTLVIETDSPDVSCSIDVYQINGQRIQPETRVDPIAGSRTYSPGCNDCEMNRLQVAEYTVVCSTFQPNLECGFRLMVEVEEEGAVDLWKLPNFVAPPPDTPAPTPAPSVQVPKTPMVNQPAFLNRDVGLLVRMEGMTEGGETLVVRPETTIAELKAVLQIILAGAPVAERMVLVSYGHVLEDGSFGLLDLLREEAEERQMPFLIAVSEIQVVG